MSLIQDFTFDRNAFLKTSELAADSAVDIINKIKNESLGSKNENNKAAALSSYMGLNKKGTGLTKLANAFLKLYFEDKAGAWEWLVTRSLWLYVVPNGTNAGINRNVAVTNRQFAFFRLLIQTLTHLQSLKDNDRFLYYEEFCEIFSVDDNWYLNSSDIFNKILEVRKIHGPRNVQLKPGFLGELEDTYDISKDNLSAFFNKVLEQTGLFEYIKANSKNVGISIRTDLDLILQKRLRFIIDNEPSWNKGDDWLDYLDLRISDLPLEVSKSKQAPAIQIGTENLQQLILDATAALVSAGFAVSNG